MKNIAQLVQANVTPILESYADDIATQRMTAILHEGGTVTPELFNLNKQIAYSILEGSVESLIPTEQDIEVDVPVNDAPADIDFAEEDIVGLVVRDAEGNEVVVPYNPGDFENEAFEEGDAPAEVQEANIAEAGMEGAEQAQAEEAIAGDIQPTGVESNEGMTPEEVVNSEKDQINAEMQEEELAESTQVETADGQAPITESTEGTASGSPAEEEKQEPITESTASASPVEETANTKKPEENQEVLTESSNEFTDSKDMIKSIIGNIAHLN